MKAKKQDHYSNKRRILHEIVPLEQPFTINFEPITFCNLRCNFCIYSQDKSVLEKGGHYFERMSNETFNRCIKQISEFKEPIKTISFIGTGEPLLHSELPEMIHKIKESKLAEKIILVTNGVLLSKGLVEKLLDAGIDVIKISVNGLSSDDYQKNCGVKINFEEYINNIKYLYENRGKCRILIKTLTSVLGDKKEDAFFNLFGDICDEISVERTMPYFEEVKYDEGVMNNGNSRYQSVNRCVKVCAAPFMRMGIRVDGAVNICGCRVGVNTPRMNVYDDSLYGIWNGEEHKEILLNILTQKFEGITRNCETCISRTDFAFEEDYLDPYADEIYERIQNGS